MQALPGVLDRLAVDSRVQVLIVTGAGTDFSAGADIADLPEDPSHFEVLHATAETALAAFPKPTIAAIQGFCIGGGCELAVACDLRLAAPGARFAITASRLGIAYPASVTQRLVRLIGPAKARYLLYTGELVDTYWALGCGLIDDITATDVHLQARALASRITTRSAVAVHAAKQAIDNPDDFVAADWHALAIGSGHYREGRDAFLRGRNSSFHSGS